MKKILIIDDDLELLSVLKICLEDAGYLIKVLSDPDLVYPTFYEFQPHLVLLDVHINEIDGQGISRELKDFKRESVVPVLLISGDKEIENDLIDSKADGFILKPFQINYLIQRIEFLLEQSILQS